ncbi:adhesin [Enterobacteriaceae bacterium ML5]|nr:adhesin [Enterobacteriaceae bacterium ML5]
MPPNTYAFDCWRVSGPSTVAYDLSSAITTENNRAGEVVSLVKNTVGSVRAACMQGGDGTTYRSYVTSLPVEKKIGEYSYLGLNEYLDAAMSINDTSAGVFYPPANYVHMGFDKNAKGGGGSSFEVQDRELVFKILIKKPFIGRVNIPQRKFLDVYVTTGNGDALRNIVYSIYYSGAFDVPQSCVLDTGTTITMDFGNIGAPLFSSAGAGNKPARINPKTHTITVKCKNIDAQALLSMRLETDSASGNAIVSSNKDVGFVVADGGQNPLVPNNIDSKIKFQLDDNSAAMVPITAWPVSITGNKPAEGKFTAEGYLRVDFD